MDRVYRNEDIFLVEILGFTNHCSLLCEYCDWEKLKFSPLDEWDLIRVRRHLEETLAFIRKYYPAAQVIEYSGGEPYVHPEVVDMVLEIFHDYWIRINTNGLHVTEKALEGLKKHGRAYLALSLDGHTLNANSFRFTKQEQLDRVVAGLERTLEADIPAALLCTIHERNIDEFPEYLSWLEERWQSEILDGRLMMAAHRLSSYGRRHPVARPEQVQRMQEAMKRSGSPLIAPIREHYLEMWNPESVCSIHRWAASIHFLGDALAETGRFISYRCGMRGIGMIGEIDLFRERERNEFSLMMEESLRTDFDEYRCQCFVDWRAFDLVFSGAIPMERAEKWFLPFRSEGVREWTKRYLAKYAGGNV